MDDAGIKAADTVAGYTRMSAAILALRRIRLASAAAALPPA